MSTLYAIYNPNKGYFYEDEDCLGGWDYDFEINEYTVLFTTKDIAEVHRSDSDQVVEVEVDINEYSIVIS